MRGGDRAARIAALNDELRIYGRGGTTVFTSGVLERGEEFVHRVLVAMRAMRDNDFTPDNDPYGEHDFGAVEVDGVKCFWKIDYYDLDLRGHSPDPANPFLTHRVLTVMLAEEY